MTFRPPKLPMIERVGFALLLSILLIPAAPTQAETAFDCLPPELPTPVQDTALRAQYPREIRAEYSDYFDQAQTYLRCLEAARSSVTAEINRAIVEYRSLELGASD